MSTTEDWNEDEWFAAYEHQRAMWESVSDEYDKQEEYNESLAEDKMYHYAQMMTCVDHLKHFGIEVDLPEYV